MQYDIKGTSDSSVMYFRAITRNGKWNDAI